MPNYLFTCPDGHETLQYRPLAEYVEQVVCECGKMADITISTRLIAHTFKPYVESNFDGTPIKIESREQRDVLCKQHHATYDRNRYHRRKEIPAAVDSISFGEVKRALETGRTPDGDRLDKPVVDTETLD